MRIRATALGSSPPCGRMIRADDVVCLLTPERFHAVGEQYDDFAQISGQEVIAFAECMAEPSSRSQLRCCFIESHSGFVYPCCVCKGSGNNGRALRLSLVMCGLLPSRHIPESRLCRARDDITDIPSREEALMGWRSFVSCGVLAFATLAASAQIPPASGGVSSQNQFR